MATRVIQGFFPGRPPQSAAAPIQPPPRAPAPPATRFGPQQVQRRSAAAPTAATRPGCPTAPPFAQSPPRIDPGQLGTNAAGQRLPAPVRAEMEAALGASFADVRIHVGPQAERIGAVAFTAGTDIYFAPGRFRPDTIQGRHLLGRTLAHVIQQRQGRVHAPNGTGLPVIRDRALDAEADRLGRHAAAGPVRGAAGWASAPRQTVQLMRRQKFEQAHNFIIPEQSGWYKAHVQQRIFHCVTVTLKVWIFHEWAEKQKGGAVNNMTRMLSPTAEAQAGVGNYGATGGKLDAAHIMNTSVRSTVMAQGQTLTPEQSGALAELREASAATTMQLKSNNVGPDKVIDTCMTEFTQSCARRRDSGEALPSAKTAIDLLADLCLARLTGSDKAADTNYQDAIAGVTAAKDASDWSVTNECGTWAKQYGFV